jgi:Fe-S cluster assembly protein SufD
MNKPKYKIAIDEYFNKIASKDETLTTLNTAFANEGAYINIPKSKVVEKPIEIIYFSTGVESALMLQPRNLVIVGENAHVQIIERHQSLNENPVLTNSVTEIFAGKRAIVDYYKIQNDLQSANLIDNTYISQKQESHVSVHTFSFGGNITRNNLNFYHFGERIDSTLKGITIIGDKQHVDHYTLVNHATPNCESHQNYKTILAGSSTGVFNGKIFVEKEAQKTDAFQQNNNILLGDKATINAKPQLEIFADDVKCSHGCTIGQLDENAMFYMQQRGIPKKEAKALGEMRKMTKGVAEEISEPSGYGIKRAGKSISSGSISPKLLKSEPLPTAKDKEEEVEDLLTESEKEMETTLNMLPKNTPYACSKSFGQCACLKPITSIDT